MGKRQLGELEVSELVSTLLLSNIASLPITDPQIPLVYAIIPIITITTFEITLSVILIKLPKIKHLISPNPSILINKGRVSKKEMRNSRISIDELFCELRQQGISDLDDVEYAILEENGKLTVIKKKSATEVTLKDLNISTKEDGIPHILISDGHIDDAGLKKTGKSREWLNHYLSKKSLSSKDVYIMTINDDDKIKIIKKKDTI